MTNLKAIKKFCSQLAREFQPQKIILFGSYAHGNPHRDSDVDLLVILPFKGESAHKAVEMRMRVPSPFPLDLLVRTPEKIKERLAMDDWFLQDILTKGKVLYEARRS